MRALAPMPFRLDVAKAQIADLNERLARTRWPDEPPLQPWSAGTSVTYVKSLVDYWHKSFDWRHSVYGSDPWHRSAFHPRAKPRAIKARFPEIRHLFLAAKGE